MGGVKFRDVPKFDGMNYVFWSKWMFAYLMSLGFEYWTIVLDGYVPPKDNRRPSTIDEIKACEENDTAMNEILAGLNASEFYKVMNYSTAKEVWDKLATMHHGESKVQKAKLQGYRGQFEGRRMQEEESIASYFQRVEEVVNTMRCLGETIDETLVVQKILRTLPARFNPKVSVVEEKDNLDTLNLSQLHGILIAYEMRTDDPKQKETAFKATKQKHQNIEEQVGCSSELDVSEEELANFVNKLPRGTGRYKGKLPLKCFNCGKIGHFSAKCLMRRNKSNSRRDISERKFSDKQTFFTQVEDGVSDYEEDDEHVVEGRNETLFFAKEDSHINEEKEEGAVYLEMELTAALDEIDKLEKNQ